MTPHLRMRQRLSSGAMMQRVITSAVLSAIVFSSGAAIAQAPFLPPVVTLDSLLRSPGPLWEQSRSRHFLLYTERDVRMPLSSKLLLDSLEDAWTHDTSLLGAHGIADPPVTVLVTHSPNRFPHFFAPSSRGVMRRESTGGDVIVLVHNDSVRAFTRHEVMHVVQYRVWGPPGAPWVDEGIATFADGRCQSTSVLAVARDLLRAEPGFTASDLADRYNGSAGPILGLRMRAYALAASLVAYVYARNGAEALRVLRRDGLPPKYLLLGDTLTLAWRKYVDQAAAEEPALSSAAIDARGCG